MPAIIVSHLSKQYSYHKKQPGLWNSVKSVFRRERLYKDAVRDISFSIEEGELVGFLGPNGAGKTTTLKMLSCILYPTSGEATVLGHVPWKRERAYQKQFSIIMGQKNQLWWDLPAMESFLLNKAIYNVPDKQFNDTVEELSALLDVRDMLHVQVRRLSLGERMRCELIAALLHRPRVLFLDEPTIGLDVIAQQHMREFIKRYNQETKTTILLTSHYMQDVEALCKRVIIINHGQIIYDGTLQKLLDRYAGHKLLKVTFTREVEKADLKAFGVIREHGSHHAILEIPKKDIKERTAGLLTALPIDDILIDEVEVEEVIRNIFSGA